MLTIIIAGIAFSAGVATGAVGAFILFCLWVDGCVRSLCGAG